MSRESEVKVCWMKRWKMERMERDSRDNKGQDEAADGEEANWRIITDG